MLHNEGLATNAQEITQVISGNIYPHIPLLVTLHATTLLLTKEQAGKLETGSLAVVSLHSTQNEEVHARHDAALCPTCRVSTQHHT